MTRLFTLVFFLVLSMSSFAKVEEQLKVPDILDASALKPAVDPCQDFYQFACGKWIDDSQIPADKDRIMHQSTALVDLTDENLRKLIERLANKDPDLQTPASPQIVDYYKSCMNFGSTTQAAHGLLQASLAEVAGISSKAEVSSWLAKNHLKGDGSLFSFGSGQDFKDSNSVIGFLDQSGMGLPEPSYYFDQDPKSREIRKKYVIHVAKLLQLAGQKPKEATAHAKIVMDFETQLASKAMSFDDRQNPVMVNHPITLQELAKLTPAIDWSVYFKELGAPPSALNINEPEFFGHMSQLVMETSLANLKTYLSWEVVSRSASATDPAMEREDFNFWNKYLHGEKEMKPRWKICTHQVERKLSYALAEVYVKTVDVQAIRAKTEDMIRWIEQVFASDLRDLSAAWLDADTAAQAVKKLGKLKQKVGAPEKWRDYSSLQMGRADSGSFLSNDIQAVMFESRRDLAKIGKPLDRTEWYMMPWEINAYYDPPNNEFVFPFGILQPPSFDLKASDGANLGAFGGGTIGHELTHGFDNDGRQYDAEGNIRDWWTAGTKQKFEEKTQCFIHQANDYKVASVGLNVDGKKSLTENLADQGGVKLGYAALLLAQKTRTASAPAQWLGKYDENQQYWIAYAQSWCGKATPEALRQQIKTNPHPPEEFRVNGVLMNRPEFAHDFACKEGSPMAPKERCSIW